MPLDWRPEAACLSYRLFAVACCAAAAGAGPLSALVGRMKNWMLNFIQVGAQWVAGSVGGQQGVVQDGGLGKPLMCCLMLPLLSFLDQTLNYSTPSAAPSSWLLPGSPRLLWHPAAPHCCLHQRACWAGPEVLLLTCQREEKECSCRFLVCAAAAASQQPVELPPSSAASSLPGMCEYNRHHSFV